MARTTHDNRGWRYVAALGLLGMACGNEKADEQQGSSSSQQTPASPMVEKDPRLSNELGGIDGAGQLPPEIGNTSPDGPVVTTLGEFMVEVRSSPALHHYFDESLNRLFLRHSVQTPSGDGLSFSFGYAGGNESFAISDLDWLGTEGPEVRKGSLSITDNGQELIARTGTVRIESMDGTTVRVVLDGIGVVPLDPLAPEDLSELRLVGSGLVSGPLRRRCLEVVEGPLITPPPVPSPFDAKELQEFCSGE